MSLSQREFLISDLVIDDEYGTISATASVSEAAQKMKELGVPDLVVLDQEANKVIGVIGDFDIVQNIVAAGKNPQETTAKEAMFVIPPVTLKTPVTEAFALMQKLNANVVPVVEGDNLVGVASTYDVWNYIPEVTSDDIGFIPIQNPKNAEFWFATICSLLAFMFIIIFPISGIIGFYSADATDVASLLNVASLRAGEFKFTLFSLHSDEYFISIFGIASEGGFWWILTAIFSVLVVFAGLLGMFSLIYASYSDLQKLPTGNLVRLVFPLVFLGLLVMEWIIYLIALNVGPADISIHLDIAGFILQILGALFIVAAIFRDNVFREENGAQAATPEAK